MDELSDVGLPVRLAGAPRSARDAESLALAAAGDEFPVASRVWVPAAAEEAFYRLNHLDARLAALFEGVVSDDPDEDEIEERAPAARSLISGHVLLDAWVDAFYDACRPLGPRVRVRRPGEAGSEVLAGRPALLALRRVWAGSWADEAIVDRLRAGGQLRATARATVVHAADRPFDDVASDPASAAQPSVRLPASVGATWQAFVDRSGALTRLQAKTASPA